MSSSTQTTAVPHKDTSPLHRRPVQFRPIGEFSIHPAIASDPRLSAKDPRYLAMQAAWTEQDGCPPVYATKDGQIVDGRHRFWWLQQMEADAVPWIEVGEDEVPQVILGALQGRNHITKGQRAYLAAPKLDGAFKAAQARRMAILQSGGRCKLPQLPSVEALAEKLGISHEFLRQARRIHEAFAAHPARMDFSGDGGGKKKLTLREYFEPRILDAEEPMGLGVALAGIGSKVSPSSAGSGARSVAARNSHLARTVHWWKSAKSTGDRWQKLKPEERDTVSDFVRDAVTHWPEDLVEVVTAAVRAARRAKAKEAADTQD
jgi:hypothetical protein